MTDPIREAFERWIRNRYGHGLRKHDFGYIDSPVRPHYENPIVQTKWEAWQAAWKQSRRETFREAAGIAEKVVNDLQLGTSASAWLAAKYIRAAAEEKRK